MYFLTYHSITLNMKINKLLIGLYYYIVPKSKKKQYSNHIEWISIRYIMPTTIEKFKSCAFRTLCHLNFIKNLIYIQYFTKMLVSLL